jgi:hypothetical protein
MLATFLLAWMLITLGSAVALPAFLAFDEWQARSLQARAQAQAAAPAQAQAEAQDVAVPAEMQQVA